MKDYSQYLIPDGYVIYLFHGVIPEQVHQVRNYTKKHLTRDEFRQQITQMCGKGTAVSMQDIVDATNRNEPLPPYAFSVTFDDGFENNYSVAAPVLDEAGVPAMYYITTGFIESNNTSWIDQIEFAFEKVSSFTFQNPYDANQSFVCDSPESKITALTEIRKFVKQSSSINSVEFAQKSLEQLKIEDIEIDPHLDQKMSWQQAAELDRHALFTIGGHTHTHPILSFLSPDELQDELDTSLSLLQKHLQRDIPHYSYPEGLAHCYNDDVIHALQTRGVICSPTAIHGDNRLGDSLFHLNRIMVE